jgi:predicted transcriptional regulator
MILKKIAVQFESLTRDKKSRILSLGKSNTLLSLKLEKTSDDKSSESFSYVLKDSSNVFINDDVILYQLFTPLIAPMDPILEEMYEKLGCQRMSNCVRRRFKIGKQVYAKSSEELQVAIRERMPLILYDTNHFQTKANIKIREDIDIAVTAVEYIECDYYFNNLSKTQGTTASLSNQNSVILYVTPEFDFFDVASNLTQLIYGVEKLNESLLISTLLSSSLESLKRKGYPVDRFLNRVKIDDSKEKELEVASFEKVTQNMRKEDNDVLSAKLDKDKSAVKDSLGGLATIQEMFPAIHSDAIKSILEQNKGDVHKAIDSIIKSGLMNNAGDIETSQNSQERLNDVEDKPQKSDATEGSKRSIFKKLFGKKQGSLSNERLSEENERRLLDDAIKSCGRTSEQKVESKPVEMISENNTENAQCEILPGHKLVYFGKVQDIPIYYHETSGVESLIKMADLLESFSSLLRRVGEKVFDLNAKAIHIFYEPEGNSIAFNRNRSLFFNVCYYANYQHHNQKDKGIYFWYMTFCHELAHNFIGYYLWFLLN